MIGILLKNLLILASGFRGGNAFFGGVCERHLRQARSFYLLLCGLDQDFPDELVQRVKGVCPR
jgi:hypothetical protein